VERGAPVLRQPIRLRCATPDRPAPSRPPLKPDGSTGGCHVAERLGGVGRTATRACSLGPPRSLSASRPPRRPPAGGRRGVRGAGPCAAKRMGCRCTGDPVWYLFLEPHSLYGGSLGGRDSAIVAVCAWVVSQATATVGTCLEAPGLGRLLDAGGLRPCALVCGPDSAVSAALPVSVFAPRCHGVLPSASACCLGSDAACQTMVRAAHSRLFPCGPCGGAHGHWARVDFSDI